MSDKKLCLYHKNCLDGFASAYIVGRYFGFTNVDFVPMDYHDPLPDLTNREVYIVDFSFTPEVLVPKLADAKRVIMLDHHSGAMDKWKLKWGIDEETPEWSQHKHFTPVFDTTKSGVGVVWSFFYGDCCDTSQLPYLLQHVQDYDLYNFSLEGTRDIHAALVNNPIVHYHLFDLFDKLVNTFEQNYEAGKESLIHTGKAILEAQKILATQCIERTLSTVKIGPHIIPIAAVPHELRDIAGEILYHAAPFSITFEDRYTEGVRKFSLRSSREHGIDVRPFATAYGGTGHFNAAGFTVPISKPEQFVDYLGLFKASQYQQ